MFNCALSSWKMRGTQHTLIGLTHLDLLRIRFDMCIKDSESITETNHDYRYNLLRGAVFGMAGDLCGMKCHKRSLDPFDESNCF